MKRRLRLLGVALSALGFPLAAAAASFVPFTSYAAPTARVGYNASLTYETSTLSLTDGMAVNGVIEIKNRNIKVLDGSKCIDVGTSQAVQVIIHDCRLVTNNIGILALGAAGVSGANLTVYNCECYGAVGSSQSQQLGKFIYALQPSNINVHHNYVEGIGFVDLNRWAGGLDGTDGRTIKVKYNRVRDMDGRSPATVATPTSGDTNGSNFVHLQHIHLAGIEIKYNEVVNRPGSSRTEDLINFFNSGGTSTSTALVQFNYLQGQYRAVWGQGAGNSGSGFTTDSDLQNKETISPYPGYILVSDNWFVSIGNDSLNMAGGALNATIVYTRNTCISCGLAEDGSRIGGIFAGCSMFDYTQVGTGWATGKSIAGNVLGVMNSQGSSLVRQDENPSRGTGQYQNQMPTGQNTYLDHTPTIDDEHACWTAWRNFVGQNGLSIGLPTGNGSLAVAATTSSSSSSTGTTGSSSTTPSTTTASGLVSADAATVTGSWTADNANKGSYASLYYSTAPGATRKYANVVTLTGVIDVLGNQGGGQQRVRICPAGGDGSNDIVNNGFDNVTSIGTTAQVIQAFPYLPTQTLLDVYVTVLDNGQKATSAGLNCH